MAKPHDLVYVAAVATKPQSVPATTMSLKVSHQISRKAATTLLHSPRTAAALGRPFNVVVCVNTWLLGVAAENTPRVFHHMRRMQFGRWSSYKPRQTGMARNGTPTDTWVFEAPNGRHHVHWMLHVQPENRAEFDLKLERWVRAMAGVAPHDSLPAGALHITAATNPEGKKLYMAKGIDPLYGRLWGIRPEDCGIVYGRRAGTARSLGPAVWKPLKRAYRNASRRSGR